MKGGGYHSVVNLKELNQFVKLEHFKMEGLHLLPSLMQQGDYMVKMDLKAGLNSPSISSFLMGGQDLSVQVQYPGSYWSTQADNDHLSGRHSYTSPKYNPASVSTF